MRLLSTIIFLSLFFFFPAYAVVGANSSGIAEVNASNESIEQSSANYELLQSNMSTLTQNRWLPNLPANDVPENTDNSITFSSHSKDANERIKKQSIDEASLSNLQVSSPIVTSLDEGDFIYNIGDMELLSWTIEDANNNGKNYSFYLNDSKVNQGVVWTENLTVYFDLSTNISVARMYNVTLLAFDQTENSGSNSFFVLAVDVLYPMKNESLSTQSPFVIEHLSTGQSFDWIYSDESGGGNYTLFIDGIRERNNLLWVSGVTISYNNINTGTANSEFNYTLVIDDYSGNSVKDSGIVNIVPQENPEVLFLNSTEYNTSNSNVNIFWSITDLSPGTIEIYVNGTLSPNQEFTSTRSEILDLSSITVYNYTIIATDELGNTTRLEQLITVFDKRTPDVISMPIVFVPLGSSAGMVINWTVSDTNPDSFNLTNDFNQASVNDTWSDNQIIQFTINNELPLGIYNVSLYINDTQGNSANILTQIVIFNSGIAPITTNGNQSAQLGFTKGIELVFTVHDPRSKSYSLKSSWNNFNISGNWSISTDSLTIQLDNTIPFGTHIYNLTNYLRDGTVSFSIIEISVIDEFIPRFLIIATNRTLEYSSEQSFEFLWTISDNNPYQFSLTNNGSLPQILNRDWSVGKMDIRYNQSLIEPGVVEFTLVITDTGMNTNQTKVFLKVIDTTFPVFLTIPPNQTVEQTVQDSVQLTWSVHDELNGTYMIKDELGQTVATGNWTYDDSIDFNVETLSPGNYKYTIFVLDNQGNSVSNTVTVIIADQAKPETRNLIYPVENLEAGSSESFIISINATDKNPHEYYLERTVAGFRFVTSGTWVSEDLTIITLDQISLGTNNFNFTLLDKFGNSKTELFTIIGEDINVPVISKPVDVSFELGTTLGNTLNWSVVDFNPDKFVIYRNDVKISSGNWKSNLNISYSFPELARGNHIFKFMVTDAVGHSSSTLTEVRVSDTTSPTFTVLPKILKIKETDTTKILSWTAKDLDPATYYIQIDGTNVSEGLWVSEQPIMLSLNNLSIGSYVLMIVFLDASGNKQTYIRTVTISDADTQIYQESVGIVIFRVFAILIALGIVAFFTTLSFFNYRGINTKEKVSELLQETKTRMQPTMNRVNSAKDRLKVKERMGSIKDKLKVKQRISSAKNKVKPSENSTQVNLSSQNDELSKKKEE